MKSIIFFTMLLITTITCYSQNVDSAKPVILNDTTAALKKNIYLIEINRRALNSSFGYLQSLNNNTISITSSPLQYGTSKDGNLMLYNSINNIRIHRKGQAGKGALIGAAGGLVLGCIIGAATYTKPSNNSTSYGWFGAGSSTFDFGAGVNIAGGGLVGLLLGLPIGILSGKSVNRYTINKNKQAFENMRSHLIDVYGMRNSVKQHD